MNGTKQNDCRCDQAACGCAREKAARCTCGEACNCTRRCRCDANCACVSKK